MGDGQHVWAAAEWVLMIRNCFVREEANRLILCAGVPQRWLSGTEPLSFGPAPTSFGKLSVSIEPLDKRRHKTVICWHGVWHGEPPRIEVRVPGFDPVTANPGQESIELTLRSRQ